jgi:hypothetical protein
MLIWRPAAQEPLNIRVTLGAQGAGWFKLERLATNGSFEFAGSRIDGTAIDGDAIFGFSAEQLGAWQWQVLSLRLSVLAGNPAGTDMPVFLLVDQPTGSPAPEDALGKALSKQANGVQLSPKLKQGKPGLFDFQVYFW